MQRRNVESDGFSMTAGCGEGDDGDGDDDHDGDDS